MDTILFDHTILFVGFYGIPVQPIQDELEEFTLTKSIISVENPREWWTQNQKDYLRLSQMALDILAIPAMSAEVERVFSSAGKLHNCPYLLQTMTEFILGLLLSNRRNRLKDDVIEAVECQKSWLRAGLLGFTEVEKLEEVLKQLEKKQGER